MVKVAVAGGTGGIGRHIVEGILATKKHSVIVLSRSSSNAILENLGAQVIAVDYNDHASLVAALQGVHTIISAIWSYEGTFAASQISLLNAAVEVGVKRFAPSEWAIASLPDEPITLYKLKAVVAAAVANSGLEWTIFQTGVFMNYFVSGTEGIGYLHSIKFIVDVENGTATVPGTGNDRVGFTRGEDVGAFVAESLSLEKWPEISGMVGEFVSYNTIIALAEKVRGRKFNVTYVSEDELRKQLVPNASAPLNRFFSEVQLEMIRGRFLYEANLNSLFPDVKPMGTEEFMRKWWA